MKTLSKLTFPLSFLLLVLSHLPAAAYYDPGLQRWLNRDPIGEAGFQTSTALQPDGWVNKDDPYTFVENTPPTLLDAQGLTGNAPPECADGMRRTRVCVRVCIISIDIVPIKFAKLCPGYLPFPKVHDGTQVCRCKDACRGGHWDTVSVYACGVCTEGVDSPVPGPKN
jgi:hypothetical protein